MIAQCPSCRARIRIELPQVVEQNLVRCSKCWFVFLVSGEELRKVQRAALAPPAATRAADTYQSEDTVPPGMEDLSMQFAKWEKHALKDGPDLSDVSLSQQFDWTGFDEREDSPDAVGDHSIGEGTILSTYESRTDGTRKGEVLCTLSVVEGPQAGLSFPIHDESFVIGRDNADCVVQDREISRQHVRIRLGSEKGKPRFEIEDLGSTNGTVVNGTRVEFSPLENCDEIEIGISKLIFFVGQPVVLTPRPAIDQRALHAMNEYAAATAEVDGDSTEVRGLGNPFLPKTALSRVRAWMEIAEGPEAGKVLDLLKGATIIGREQADVLLDDPLVSRKHALIEVLSGDQIYLKDLASKNGTVVNGILVKVARLQPGDSIQIGDTRLRFGAEMLG